MFVQPTFNLMVNVWRFGNATTNPPDATCMGNLAWGRRVNAPFSGGTLSLGVVSVSSILLVPALTDLRDGSDGTDPDTVEVPAGSGRFYLTVIVDDIGKGFANEHRAACLVKTGTWPAPIP